MIEPLRVSFDVVCSVEHAFEMWTSGIGLWWPPSHTVSREPGLVVVLEASAGGRIYERTPGGVEHDWGEVTLWGPPTRLGYLWHLRHDRSDATDVEVRFVGQGELRTRVEIEHRGWERLGAAGQDRRDQNRAGWGRLLPYYAAAIDKEPARGDSR